jgi:F-type H+-transporting ATPase subunit b
VNGRLARAWIAAAVSLLVALPAGAEGESHGGARELLFSALNLALVLGVLFYFARKPITEFFESRRRRIQAELETAKKQGEEAEARYAKWQRRLMDLESELAGIRETSRQRAAAEREHILADAAEGAERIRREALETVDQELRRARAQLRREAADLAVELASEALRRQVSSTDQDRLLDEFAAAIERAPANGDGRPGSES